MSKADLSDVDVLSAEPEQAWLVLAVGDDRQHGGNEGYDDEPPAHYSWDSTVHNHGRLAIGDAIVIWNKRTLLGVSLIEDIKRSERTKTLFRCARCERAGIKARKTVRPLYKCYKCGSEFDDPITLRKRVTTYRSRHDRAWMDLQGLLPGAELRALAELPNSQLSLRRLNWDRFKAAVIQADPTLAPPT